YHKNPYQGLHGWDGCTDLTNGMLGRVESIAVDAVGSVSGATDSYFFVDTTAYPQKQLNSSAMPQIAAVGSHTYIAGSGPLQYIGATSRAVGWYRAEVDSHALSTSESTATLDMKGHLSWSTNYQYKITHYDPITGDESNPYGPFRFRTDTQPGSIPVDYGTAGCAFKVETKLYTPQNLAGQEVKYYRYHSGVGAYHLEGHSKVTDPVWSSAYDAFYWESNFIFSMTEDELQLKGSELQLDNDSPPLHTACTIWNGRAFYVDALRPSRVVFSKPFQFGSVPGANLLWTDEGTGGNILGFLPGFGGLLVLRESSIWIIPQFVTADQAFIQPLLPDTGCVSGAAAVFAEGVLWIASPGGIYSFNGSDPPFNHSERLDGLDWNVWDHSPRETRAYYDRKSWTIVFTCDGTGISIDVRSNATALISAPERIAIQCNTSDYRGPIFGSDGMVWRQFKTSGTSPSNRTLSLDLGGTGVCDNQVVRLGATTFSALNWHWTEEGNSGTVLCGRTATALSGSAEWLTDTSEVGRSYTNYKRNGSDIWTVTLHDGDGGSGSFFRSTQGLLDWMSLDFTPMYYRSQDLYLGRYRGGRIYERMDLAFDTLGKEGHYTSVTCGVAFYALLPETATPQKTSAQGADLESNSDYQLPLRMRGHQCYYELLHEHDSELQPLNAIGIHFRVSKTRGRVR
ncbi:MAG: hypothetical protein ACXABY_09920, partial [Candidatus Thorarchaeota archaeon]